MCTSDELRGVQMVLHMLLDTALTFPFGPTLKQLMRQTLDIVKQDETVCAETPELKTRLKCLSYSIIVLFGGASLEGEETNVFLSRIVMDDAEYLLPRMMHCLLMMVVAILVLLDNFMCLTMDKLFSRVLYRILSASHKRVMAMKRAAVTTGCPEARMHATINKVVNTLGGGDTLLQHGRPLSNAERRATADHVAERMHAKIMTDATPGSNMRIFMTRSIEAKRAMIRALQAYRAHAQRILGELIELDVPMAIDNISARRFRNAQLLTRSRGIMSRTNNRGARHRTSARM